MRVRMSFFRITPNKGMPRTSASYHKRKLGLYLIPARMARIAETRAARKKGQYDAKAPETAIRILVCRGSSCPMVSTNFKSSGTTNTMSENIAPPTTMATTTG